VLLAAALAALELFRMTHPGDGVSQAIGMVSTLLVTTLLYLFPNDPRVLISVLLLVPALGVLVPLLGLVDIHTASVRVMAGVAGPLYLGCALASLALLRRDAGSTGAGWVVLTLMFAWLGDTGGYFFGRFLGKTK